MDPARYQLLCDLFARALRLAPDQRTAMLAKACGSDAELRVSVEEMLTHDQSPQGGIGMEAGAGGDWIAQHVLAGREQEEDYEPDSLAGLDLAGEHIGPFKLLRLLGQGGMGTVFEAAQERPSRRVALKVLAAGRFADDAVARFTREADVLGRFHHPGVAQVFETGVDDSRPGPPIHYFTMELVEGVPLTEYAARAGLDRRARLVLISRVCDAVAHAHERGVIHRDLKPANVLVEATGQPKVLDFGIARTSHLGDAMLTLQTRTGEILGTLPYMSPEQASGGGQREVDQRTDVYALGVLGFELLTGRLPHDFGLLPLSQALRILCDSDAQRLVKVDPSCRGDLDVIFGKALDRDPEQRYASAAALAADLRSYLRHEPILARPPSTLYRTRRFVHRHRALVVGAAATFVALVIGLIVTLIFAAGEARERAEAQLSEYAALLQTAATSLRELDETSARDALERAAPRLRGWEWRYYMARVDELSIPFEVPVPQGPPRAIAYAPDGRSLTVLTRTGVFRVDARMGAVATLRETSADEEHLELSPDGRWAVLVRGGGVHMEQLEGGREVRLVDAPGNVGFDPTGRFVAAVGTGSARMLEVETGRELGHVDAAGAKHVKVDLAGRVCVTNPPETGGAWLWEPSSGSRLAFDAPALTETVLTPDGARVIGWSSEATWVWNAATGAPLRGDTMWRAESASVAFNPDGELALVVADYQAILTAAQDGRTLKVLGAARPELATFCPTGRLLALCRPGGEVRLVDSKRLHPVAILEGVGHVKEVGFSPDGEQFAAIDEDGLGRLWCIAARDDARVLRGHQSYVYGVSVSPDGTRVASGAWDGTVRLWESRTGRPVATLEAPSTEGYRGLVAFHPAGGLLASAHDDLPSIWEAETGALVATVDLGPHREETDDGTAGVGGITSIAWHPREPLLAIGSDLHQARLVRMAADGTTSTESLTVPGGKLAFSPDGRLLALAGGGVDVNRIVLWDTEKRRTAATWADCPTQIHCLAFHPDGESLASASGDGTLRVWSVPDGEVLLQVRRNERELFAVVFSPDGCRLLAGGRDGVIRVWDPVSGAELAALRGHEDYVHSLCFDPYGEMLVSSSGDQTVRIWQAMPME